MLGSCWVVIVGFVDFVVLLVSGNTELFCVCFLIVNNCKLFVALFCTKEVLFFGPICGRKSVNFLLFFLAFGTHLIKDIESSLFFLCSLFLFSVLVSISILFRRGLNFFLVFSLCASSLIGCKSIFFWKTFLYGVSKGGGP